MKEVRFTRSRPPYTTGDVAQFEDKVADDFVTMGAAEYYQPPLAKNLDAPPEDKMMKSSEVKKK